MNVATISAYMNTLVDDTITVQLIWIVPLAVLALGGIAVVRFIINQTYNITMR